MPSAKRQASLHPGRTGSGCVPTPPAQKEPQCSLVQPWSKPEQPKAMDGMFQDEHHPPKLCVFYDWRYSIACRYFLPKSSIWKSRCFGKNGVFINLYLDSHGELKGCLSNALNSLTTKLSEKKACAFLSYKISQLLPVFPSRTIFICFLSLQPTFLENFNIQSKAKNLLLLLSHIYGSCYTCAILHFIWKHAECSHIEEFHVPQ